MLPPMPSCIHTTCSEVELAAIAHELDAAERELMASAGVDSAEFAAYVAEGSGNVAEHGMFSIQACLGGVWRWVMRWGRARSGCMVLLACAGDAG